MLNLNKVGRPLCLISGGKYKGHVVSVSDNLTATDDDHTLIKEFKQLRIANDSAFQQVPDSTKNREILYITGPSGSGKSTYTRKYLEQYKKKYKHNPIYLFSALPDDESLDDIKPKRIMIDESLVNDPISVEEFRDCAVIFDDIDVISNKLIRAEIYNILNKILEIGRHFSITCIVTNHLPTNGRDTRRILNESHSVTYFPHSASGRIKYLLIDYLGIDKKMIRKFRISNSRWCTIFKNYPQLYMLEREIGLLNEDDNI